MTVKRHLNDLRGLRREMVSLKDRLGAIWRDPLADRVMQTYWRPVLVEVEKLEADMVSFDLSLTRTMAELREIERTCPRV